MAGTIKITSLTDIGATIPDTTLLPVVDMLPSPTTMKATVANLANAILSEAGNLYVVATEAENANTANTAGTVTVNAQPNITSIGTLTSFTATGNVTLGAVGNVHITGGTNGYLLSTNGNGNLSWVAPVATGNISTINLDGNVSNVLAGNGTWISAGGMGVSGYSGTSGFSGQDGASGFSGFSGIDGASGFSGFSGIDGASGISGYSGIDGASGYSGFAGVVWSTAPVANTSAGIAGEIAYDSGGNLYIAVATNTWSKFTGTTSW